MNSNSLTLFIVIVLFLSCPNANAQNSFLGLDGGFEGTAIVDNAIAISSPQPGKWAKANAFLTIGEELSVIRSGCKSLKISINPSTTSTSTCRIFSPQFTIPESTSKWVVQFYRRSASTANSIQCLVGNFRNGDETKTATYNSSSNADVWERVTYSPTSITGAKTAAAHIMAKMLGAGGDLYVDDFCLYESSGIDDKAPNSPSASFIDNATDNSLRVNWAEANGGVDGGGYMVVRGVADPTIAPNVNGIYAVGNLITSGETVVYKGTATSFVDNGLVRGSHCFYRIYTYDKAYNYSNPSLLDGVVNASLGVGLVSNNLGVLVKVSDGHLEVSGVDNFEVFSCEGVKLFEKKGFENPIIQLQRGVYIIKTGNVVRKVLIR